MRTTDLRTSCDRKVRMYPSHRNSFGCLPGPVAEGGTCPGCTCGEGGCWMAAKKGGITKVCYVDKLARVWKEVRGLLGANTAKLKKACPGKKYDLFRTMFEKFDADCRAYMHRNPGTDVRYFRLYWSGDVMDMDTALALRRAIREFTHIRFWLYTRSFGVVRTLAGIRNLRLFVSLDAVNCKEGMRRFWGLSQRGKLSMAYMGTENPYGFVACPVDSDMQALEEACSRCRLCLPGSVANVWFRTK